MLQELQLMSIASLLSQVGSQTTSLAFFWRSHTFAIIEILDLKIHQSMVDTVTLFSKT